MPFSQSQPLTLDDVQEEISDFVDAEERLTYLIELGDTLADFPSDWCIEANRVLGCQSNVWIVPKVEEGRLYFAATSDAPMVKGLVAIVVAAYNGKTPEEILEFPIEDFFKQIQLGSFITPMRSNGLHSMVQQVKSIAEQNRTTSSSSHPNLPPTKPKTTPTRTLSEVRSDFPILNRTLDDQRPLIYLDSAASSQRPTSVIQRMTEAYTNFYSNVHRSGHQLAAETTEAMEESRESIRGFINAESTQQVVFTSGTTMGINLVAHGWGIKNLKLGDEILLTEMEHHANIVPWQQIAAQTGAIIRWASVNDQYLLDLNQIETLLTPKTKIFSFTAVSNVLGTINPVTELVRMAHAKGIPCLVDAAQAIPHASVNVQAWDADFVVFSGHKMLGPTGIGVLYGKQNQLESLPPFLGGGNMIKTVDFDGFTMADPPHRFEAGTAPIVEAIGMKPAVDYLSSLGEEQILAHEQALVELTHQRLSDTPGLKLLSPSIQSKSGIVSFVVDGVHTQQIGEFLNTRGIAIRTGHHCAMPLHKKLNITSSCRASFYLYNTHDEANQLCDAIQDAVRLFKRS